MKSLQSSQTDRQAQASAQKSKSSHRRYARWMALPLVCCALAIAATLAVGAPAQAVADEPASTLEDGIPLEPSFDDLEISTIYTQQYTGMPITPTPTISLLKTTLVKDTDYKLMYRNNKEVGTAIIDIIGINDYSGQKSAVTFKIANVARLAGSDALGTMKAITQQGFEDGSCSSLVIATMGGYWDALTASGLAGLLGCPVLMTNGTSLSSQTKSEIIRLAGENSVEIFIAGGPAAVSHTVEDQINLLYLDGVSIASVERVYGDDALGTARSIFAKGAQLSTWSKMCIVATAGGYWDALSASPLAYNQSTPIFLVAPGATSLDQATYDVIRDYGFTEVIITGGTSAVSAEVETQLAGLSNVSVLRLSGDTAVDTSIAIAKFCMSQDMVYDGMGVATSGGYYDALAGASLCGKLGSPLVLINDTQRQAATDPIGANKNAIDTVYVFGGTAAVSANSFTAVANGLGMNYKYTKDFVTVPN